MASRLEGVAPVGGVALSSETKERLDGAQTRPLGLIDLKGRAQPLEVFQLLSTDRSFGNGA